MTNKSQVALNEILKQQFKDTCLKHLVGLLSKAYSGNERNYAAEYIKLYAVLRVVEQFRMLRLCRELLILKVVILHLSKYIQY